jgi:3-methyladenine DNA glycosylase AlkD
MMTANAVLKKLQEIADPEVAASAAHFGIDTPNIYGVTAPQLRALGKDIGKNHQLALELWKSGVLEARILCSLIADPRLLTEVQMERWVSDFDSWAVCDACCANLFDKTPVAWAKAAEWTNRTAEYGKRAGFSMMAVLAVHDKIAPDKRFIEFLPMIKRESGDDRNFVKKSVNWALRQIGKRNLALNIRALKTAREIRDIGTPSGRWIASDAIRELSSDAVQHRLAEVQRPALKSL